jgi:serine protease
VFLAVVIAIVGFIIPRVHQLSAFSQRAVVAAPQPLIGSQAAANAPGSLQLTADRAAALLDAHDRHLSYVPGEVLVRFKAGMSPAQQQRALMALRSRPSVGALHWLSSGVALLRDQTQPDAHILAQQLSEQPEVDSAQPNFIRHLATRPRRVLSTLSTNAIRVQGTPNDPGYAGLQWNFSMIDMPHAWDINPGATPTVIVATVDTGVTVAPQTINVPLFTGSSIQTVSLPFDVSPDLPPSRLVSPIDFVFSANGGPVLDFDGHGTHVSSTIGEATNNAIALAGMAYNARIMPVKVCVGYWELMIARAQAGITGFIPPESGGCPDDAIASGIMYAADHGAQIINLSLGGPDPDPILRDAMTYAVQKGAFVAVAMGNDFQAGNPVEYPAFYAAQIDGAMSVAAVGKSMAQAYYSSTGSYCEITAPGGDDTDGGGQDLGFIWQVTLDFRDQDPSVIVPRFDRYGSVGYEGTSQSTPHVSGQAALLFSQGVTSPAAIEALIRLTAKDLGQAGRDDTFGFGLIQPRTALFGLGIIK